MISSASSSLLHHPRRRPIAISVAALYAVSMTCAWATPPAVTNCNDSGAGSLRDAVAGAVSGDTIDMSALTTSDPGCSTSTITLTTGAIVVGQQILTINGPGKGQLTVKQTAPNSRVIVHNYAGSSGHLYLSGFRVGYGYISSSGTVHGGCVASLSGALTLHSFGAYHCGATTTGLSSDYPVPNAFGGAVFAGSGLTMSSTVILHGTAHATSGGVRAQGGCAMTPGAFNMIDSIVAYCSATNAAGSGGRGGALKLRGNVFIKRSLIALSHASSISGGVDINSPAPDALTATIMNSTIAYNSSDYLVGGMYTNFGHVNIDNSTIVFNQAASYTYTYKAKTYNAAPGATVVSVNATALSLQSTIISDNSSNGKEVDLSTGAPVVSATAITGSNNLVRAYLSDVTLPSGQGNLQQGTCPLLGHLRNSGGETYAFAPQSGSPLIDAGNDTAIDPSTSAPAVYDQRSGPPPPPIAQPPDGYPRVSGTSADIGAIEVQKSDIVFYTEFETHCL